MTLYVFEYFVRVIISKSIGGVPALISRHESEDVCQKIKQNAPLSVQLLGIFSVRLLASPRRCLVNAQCASHKYDSNLNDNKD